MMLQTPVLFLVFNRPENTAQVFAAIRRARPKQLFIAADGAREGVIEEFGKCAAVRKIVLDIDWDCEVKTLFREKNLGCKNAVSSGIDWFFTNVEEGIILEDDCVPDPSFFKFCEKLLSYYREDKRIMMVCGTNYLTEDINNGISDSYFFSNYYPIWGWATWKRAWQQYDVHMSAWPQFKEEDELKWLLPNPVLADYYKSMFDMLRDGFDTWDIQWWFNCIFNSGLSIIPKYNLISNIGIVGTHSDTQGDFFIEKETKAIDVEALIHPPYVYARKNLNEMTYRMSHAQSNLEEVKTSFFSEQQLQKLIDSVPRSLIIHSLRKRIRKKFLR